MAAVKKGGLGRGLDALFVENAADKTVQDTLPISEIEPDRDQPRKMFDDEALGELAASISIHGVLQPIVVRPSTDGRYIIVAGERRWRAARRAGLDSVPVIIKEMTRQEADEIALIENLQREDLNPIEEGAGYKKLMEAYALTQDQVAQRVGKSRPNIANAIRILSLPQPVIQLISDAKMSAGHGRALLSLEDEEKIQKAATVVVKDMLSVRKTEALVKQMLKAPKTAKKQPPKQTFYKEVELALGESLGRKVQIVQKGTGGTIMIAFFDSQELENLANKLSKE